MRENITVDRAIFRFLVWISASSFVAAVTATRFVPLLIMQLNVNFDSVFPAIPFAALLMVIMGLRWKDLRVLLLTERSFRSELLTRLIGVFVAFFLIALRGFTGRWVETAGVALIGTFYAVALMIYPSTKRIMFPYMIIYSAGIAMPAILEEAFGGPLALVSTSLSARLVWLLGLPVSWAGSHFTLVSRFGGVVSGTVTPGCSSIISITTFVGLLTLMHLDLRKDVYCTMKMAIAGVVALFALNVLRINVLIWIGYLVGANALWAIHDWLGYAIFIGFYFATLVVYTRRGEQTTSRLPAFGIKSWFRTQDLVRSYQ